MSNRNTSGDEDKDRAVRALAIVAVKIAKTTARTGETEPAEGGADVN